MKHVSCDVLVVGGGATGTGLARDLSMRGLKTVLVERRDLTHGTTGRFHGLLHSGGRYVVKDPQAARECYEENRILRRIMPHCLEDTGGFFVLTPWDDSSYAPRFLEGCRQAGIPVEDIPISQMLKEEPLLNTSITRCFRVPDAAADSFLAADLNAMSARQHGAVILTYHEVLHLLSKNKQINGALCHDLVKDEQVQIYASIVVNAAGAWAGKIAATAGIAIHMIPGKGTMVAVNHRLVNTVINRCKLPSDGDILVPSHTVAVMGTTDIKVSDPDSFGIEPWELRLMLEEGEKLIPNIRSFRLLRAWAGVRPLFQETVSTAVNRDVTRAFVLLDHAQRDGIEGLLTITSGKWTTYRKMAEVTADKVCEKLGIHAECRTHLEALPNQSSQLSSTAHYHHLGARLADIEHQQSYGNLVCECELVTIADIEQTILQDDIHTLDDIRRDLRLGMGPCQGEFCTLRAAGLLHTLRHPPILETNAAIRDFLEERWKGQLPILWGQQLRQARLNELIYQDVLNARQLPGVPASRLAAEKYASPNTEHTPVPVSESPSPAAPSTSPLPARRSDTLVIGSGLSGLVTGWRALQNGKKTCIIARGWGATHWGSGCIDVLSDQPLEAFIAANPTHPYAVAGLPALEQVLCSFQALCASDDYPMLGSLHESWLLPTALGTLRSTCLAPITMTAGDLHQRAPVLVVGFLQFLDFFPSLVAENLNAQSIFAADLTLDLPSLQSRRFVTGMVLARLFDTPTFRAEVAEALRGRLGSAARIGFPAVLGLKEPLTVMKDLEERLGLPIFEIPGLPPSIPGIRIHSILCNAIEQLGGSIFNGMQVIGCETSNGRIQSVFSEAAARRKTHAADSFVLATGGLLGGGIHLSASGYAQETALGLSIQTPADRAAWHHPVFLSAEPHPLHCIGLSVNPSFQPLDAHREPFYQNLYAVGSALGGFDPIHEHSLEGVSLVTGYLTGEALA
jgi:glycerol-3-phosphate dehydrogenase